VTVPAPTNPKKQSLMPSGPLRKALRAAGHHLSPVVRVGKEGLTAAVVAQLDEALLAHELVKLKVGTEAPEDRFEVAAALAGLPGAHVAQVLGRTMLVYRKHPQKPRFEAGPPGLGVPAPKARPAGRRRPDRMAPKQKVRRPPPRRSPG
jgi:RNA-binding protein